MDIKVKSQILKKRAKELGYDIKLTHAQEMISAIFGHESRHSALIVDKKEDNNLEFSPNAKKILEKYSTPEAYKSQFLRDDKIDKTNTFKISPDIENMTEVELALYAIETGLEISKDVEPKLKSEIEKMESVLDQALKQVLDKKISDKKNKIFEEAFIIGIQMRLNLVKENPEFPKYIRHLQENFKNLGGIKKLIGEALNQRNKS